MKNLKNLSLNIVAVLVAITLIAGSFFRNNQVVEAISTYTSLYVPAGGNYDFSKVCCNGIVEDQKSVNDVTGGSGVGGGSSLGGQIATGGLFTGEAIIPWLGILLSEVTKGDAYLHLFSSKKQSLALVMTQGGYCQTITSECEDEDSMPEYLYFGVADRASSGSVGI